MNKGLNDFNSLFSLVPSINILLISNKNETLQNALQDLIKNDDGILTSIDISTLSSNKQKLYRKNFEYAILCDSLDFIDKKDKFINLIHDSIGNSAELILLEKKSCDLEFLKNILENNGFGAINSIDIFDDYHLVMGKKLHMWGMD